ncbi:helix-turn-helix domain-containing protein [Streptomyces sp. NPDC059850]|uniref:helix-turn-helix domain-containing protein n=1 Tax=Streptomyces sp. NPDC059850 TaxID=3346970 RepID=UPI00364EBA42
MSIRGAARELVYDHAYLSRVLAGKQLPSPQLAKALDRLLGAGGELVSLAAKMAATESRPGCALAAPASVADFLPPENPLEPLAVRTSRRVGAETVADLSQRVHALRLADDVVYGRDLIGPALRELKAAVRLYRESTHAESVGRELLRTIGELAQIAGWVASDAGLYDEAERIYRLGLSAVQTAGDRTLAGQLLGSLAYQVANVGDARDAVGMAVAAASTAGPDAPPRARALFLDRVAWAHAKAGDTQPAMRALADAHEALTSERGADEPTWTYWVSREELEVMDARVYTELRRPLRAVPLLRRVLGQYDATHTRELALYLSWLAMALADANEPEEAAATTERVITLSSSGASERTTVRSAALLKRLEDFQDVPEVASLLAEHRAA